MRVEKEKQIFYLPLKQSLFLLDFDIYVATVAASTATNAYKIIFVKEPLQFNYVNQTLLPIFLTVLFIHLFFFDGHHFCASVVYCPFPILDLRLMVRRANVNGSTSRLLNIDKQKKWKNEKFNAKKEMLFSFEWT